MEQVDEFLEQHILSFLDPTCINIVEYVIKEIHRKKYISAVHFFDKKKVCERIFSGIDFYNNPRISVRTRESLFFRINLDADGGVLKTKSYELQGLTFVLRNGNLFLVKKDRRLLDFFQFNSKQKRTEWYLSKIFDLYPII